MSVSEVYVHVCWCVAQQLTIGVKFHSVRSKLPFPRVGGDSDGCLSKHTIPYCNLYFSSIFLFCLFGWSTLRFQLFYGENKLISWRLSPLFKSSSIIIIIRASNLK